MDTIITPYEPKKENRWVVESPEFSEIKWLLYKTSRPSGIMEDNRVKLNQIDIEFRDAVEISSARVIWNLIENQIENKTFSYKLSLLSPVGEIIESWEINDCLITNFDFGTLDYDSEKILNCRCTFIPGSVKLLD